MQSFEYKRRQKAGGFLGPISSKINVAKEKERRKRKSEEEEGRRRDKKSNGCTLSFSNVYFEDFLTENKKLLKGKGPFGGNVFKNPARYTYYVIS